MPPLGERFRAAREARGLSLSDVAEQIRIRSVYLAAIEDENWPAIGAPVYIRGFLRTYARFLGLEPEDVVRDFNNERAQPEPVEGETFGARPTVGTTPSRNLSWMIWVASAVAVLLIAFVVYNELTLRARTTDVAAASPTPSAAAELPSNAPSPAASGAPEASPLPSSLPNSLEIRLSAPSWVRVVVDGNVSMEGTFPAGTVKQFHGKVALLRIGNAGGVAILVDGKDVGKLGTAGDVIERSFTL